MLIDGHIVTHDTLVTRAEKWLIQQGCGVTFRDEFHGRSLTRLMNCRKDGAYYGLPKKQLRKFTDILPGIPAGGAISRLIRAREVKQ